MKLLLTALLVSVAIAAAPLAAAEAEVARIKEACLDVRRALPPVCTCFADMAENDLDDGEQSLLAAWMARDYDEAARLMRVLDYEQTSRVAFFEGRNLSFCAQYS